MALEEIALSLCSPVGMDAGPGAYMMAAVFDVVCSCRPFVVEMHFFSFRAGTNLYDNCDSGHH